MTRPIRSLTILAALYVGAQMLADIASLRVISLWGVAVDAGTLIYPFTFTLRDLVHKVGGERVARTLIFLAALINLFMAGFFALVAWLPADPVTGPQPEFGALLAPVWGIVVASIVAEVISQLIDTEAYTRWVKRFGERHQWGRVLASNGIAVPVDSAVFVGLATVFGVFDPAVAMTIFLANVAIKWIVTVVSIPWIYLVRPTPIAADDS